VLINGPLFENSEFFFFLAAVPSFKELLDSCPASIPQELSLELLVPSINGAVIRILAEIGALMDAGKDHFPPLLIFFLPG